MMNKARIYEGEGDVSDLSRVRGEEEREGREEERGGGKGRGGGRGRGTPSVLGLRLSQGNG